MDLDLQWLIPIVLGFIEKKKEKKKNGTNIVLLDRVSTSFQKESPAVNNKVQFHIINNSKSLYKHLQEIKRN